MVEEDSLCAVCFTKCDPFGDHHVGCRGNRDHIACHDSLRDILFSATQSAALVPQKEMPSLIPGGSSCPANIFLPYWKCGHPVALDVTIISPLQKLTFSSAAVSQGHALTVGDARKRAAHAEECHNLGITFIHLTVERSMQAGALRLHPALQPLVTFGARGWVWILITAYPICSRDWQSIYGKATQLCGPPSHRFFLHR